VSITEEQLEELEAKAKRVLEALGEDIAPVVVEFAGSPKSGKSTTIDIVSHFYKRVGYSVHAPSEGASKRTPYHLRQDLVAFNSWTLNYAVSELLVTYHNVDRPHLIFLDRGPFDSIAWMRVLSKRGELTNEERLTIEAFALHPRWTELISRLYLFTCAPATSLERENESKLIQRSGTAMNTSMLEELLAEYSGMETELKELYPVKPFQTSADTTPKATSYEIAEDILGLFEQRVE
jgi:hypothetical protein